MADDNVRSQLMGEHRIEELKIKIFEKGIEYGQFLKYMGASLNNSKQKAMQLPPIKNDAHIRFAINSSANAEDFYRNYENATEIINEIFPRSPEKNREYKKQLVELAKEFDSSHNQLVDYLTKFATKKL